MMIKSNNHIFLKRPLGIFSFLLILIFLVNPVSAQNLIVNGDLNGNTTTWSTCYPSWTCLSTDCIANGAGHTFSSFAGVGNCPYGLAQDCDGSYGWFASYTTNTEYLMQSIPTTVGVTYVIEFYYTNLSLYNDNCTGISTVWSRSWDNDGSVQVKVDGALIATTPSVSPSPLPGGNTWSYFATTFTATATSHWIRFDGILNTFNPPAPYVGLGIDLIGVRLPTDEGSTFGAAYNGIDDDGDGLIDCLDPDCAAFCGANNLCNAILPAELLSFETICDDQMVELSWQTASEINNNYFTIERSSDGIIFNAIATIKANGNSSAVIDYSWIDDSPLSGTSYYRLKQTDFDGRFEYLGIRSLSCDKISPITIYPNPFSTNFTVELSDAIKYPLTITMHDCLGREVCHKTITEETQRVKINLDEQLPTGSYFVKVFNENQQTVERLIKLN